MLERMQVVSAAALIGLGASAALADQANNNTPLDTTSNVGQFRDSLSGVMAPSYDGPIRWAAMNVRSVSERTDSGICFGLAMGAFFGAAIGGFSSVVMRDSKNFGRLMSVGVLGGAAIGTAFGSRLGEVSSDDAVRAVSFNTTVQEVVQAEPAHAEVIRGGKPVLDVTKSPFFKQVVTIPETNLLLSANAYQAPLAPGEKINTHFYINQAGQIISWFAEPAAR